MSIEQTSQLIQLILNSLLLLMVATLVLAGLSLRLHTSVQQLRATHHDYLSQMTDLGPTALAQLSRVKLRLQQLRSHYRRTHHAVLAAHYALLVCGGSTLILAARTLVNANWFIPVALGLFVLGSSLLLFSVGLALLDLWQCHEGLKTEVNPVLQSNDRSERASLAQQGAHLSRSALGRLKHH